MKPVFDDARCKDIEYRIKAVIRYSLKRTAEEGEKYAKEMEGEKSLKMPKTNESKAFSFKDFRPLDFGMVRKLVGINDRDYFASIGHTKFEWHAMSGKSGSLFAVTQDKKLLIKTVTKDESKTIRNVILPQLLEYIKQEPNTLILPILGLHKFAIEKTDFRFVVMRYLYSPPPTASPSVGSLSPTSGASSPLRGSDVSPNFEIVKSYDIKGSLTDRLAKEGETVKKDQDVVNENVKFNIGQELMLEVLFQLKKDVNFLTACEVMDYSLLIGVVSSLGMETAFQQWIKQNEEKGKEKYQIMQSTQNTQEVYYFGIIDYFTKYGLMKKAAKGVKSIKNDPSTLSTMPPSGYSDRFMQFVAKLFA